MTAVTAIQYTQDQMRTLTGVSAETVRHWRKTVPYLASKTGKAARFSFADLLGLSVTNELVSSLGVHIGSVSTGVDGLFKLLAGASAPTLDGAIVLVTSITAGLYESGSWHGASALTQPTLVIPLDPLIAQLQQHMLPVMPAPTQAALPFPPEAVRSRV
ncbi:MAG: MerR family transcriptional regulator [Betaproteobacteria bacterium]|nr:MerR family transcriptional regulator [Betaproteobacteria bacterium]